MSSQNKLFYPFLFLLCFLIFYGLGKYIIFDRSFFNQQNTDRKIEQLPNKEREFGLIFFGCSTCPASNNKKIQTSFKVIIDSLSEYAKNRQVGFTKIGISNERSIEEGLNHLSNYSEFDEISVGNGMANLALQKYTWKYMDEFSLSGATPQIIIVHRIYEKSYNQSDSSNTFFIPKIKEERVLIRKVGQEIIHFSSVDFIENIDEYFQ